LGPKSRFPPFLGFLIGSQISFSDFPKIMKTSIDFCRLCFNKLCLCSYAIFWMHNHVLLSCIDL
jgi:hypothetical protein